MATSSAHAPHPESLKDDSTRSLSSGEHRRAVERGAFLFGVFGVPEADEETSLSAAFAFSLHDGFEGVNVGLDRS